MTSAALILAAVIVGTWNGEWFPSGRAEHRAHPEIEDAAIRAAGEMIRTGLARNDPHGTNDVILCLNEIRDRETAAALCREIGRADLWQGRIGVTYPGHGKFPTSIFDYVLHRGFSTAGNPWTVSAAGLSDHDAVFVLLQL